MSNQPIGTSIINDNRAVSTLIGVVLLFGFLIIALSVYQAESVPQQNAETEFQHSEDVKNDLIVVRNAISRAGQQNQSQFESVRLGTTYRERVIALNPPDPAGTLRTSDAYDITIEGDNTKTVETRFFKYQNGYNELSFAPIYYENSVLYLDSEGGDPVIFEDQNLVQDNGDKVVITALQRELSTSSTGRVTLELYPTNAGAPLPSGELIVTLPTRFEENEYWSDQINPGEQEAVIDFNHIASDSDENPYPDDVSAIRIKVDSTQLEFNTVGINDYPDQKNKGVISDIEDTIPVSDNDGSFSGTVTNLEDTGLDTVDVTFTDGGDAFTKTVKTNAEGEYTVKGVEEGTYDITASAEDFIPDTSTDVKIEAGKETTDVNFTLDELQGDEVAFDANGNAYTAAEISDGDADGTDLTIVDDVSAGKLDINLNSLEIKPGVTVETTGNGNDELKINVEGGSIDVSGATLKRGGGAADKDLKLEIANGDGNINIEDATLQSGAEIKVKGNKDGNNKLFANTDGGSGGTRIVDNGGAETTLIYKDIGGDIIPGDEPATKNNFEDLAGIKEEE